MPKYQIVDEPRPGLLSRVAVMPWWPLLASMLGGPWIGWPWFLLNAHAIGSPNRLRVTLVVLGGFLATGGIVVALALAIETNIVEGPLALGLIRVGLIVWKLGVAYALFAMQARPAALFEYYRGKVRNGIVVVVIAFFVTPYVLGSLPTFAKLVLR